MLLPDLHALARAIPHTQQLAMYATNPAVVDALRQLYLIRVTPLTIGCSALPVATVLAADYALNSWTVLAQRHSGNASHGLGNASAWSILARIRNSQDARGLYSRERGELWVLHNTVPSDAVASSSSEAPPSRMELLRFRHSESGRDGPRGAFRLRHRARLDYAASDPHVAEKNWVPLRIVRTQGASTRHELFVSYSLLPHTVLRCDVDSHRSVAPCVVAHETGSASVWAMALRGLPPLLASNASRGNVRILHHAQHPPPRGGTPCVRLFASLVCLGHLKARLRGQYKSTYFHVFYALQPHAPFRVTNVSAPFRFAPLGRAALEQTRAALGRSFSRKLTSFVQEKIQFALGLLVLRPHEAMRGGAAEVARTRVVVSWGVADCTGVQRELDAGVVRAMLSGSTRVETL